ncbi:ABC transporter ATP-binding protein [Aureimonas populi]|uniref:ABC transporter ATP-binding protein n=1 Tax=Aureimonas populi TaxID=1701758 RepID=A0ABW5CLJ6_9HYPH|nr:oligopeptide/dipeptide ABC transporter ATP-binding protein [Aureimonas populi]
MSALLTIDHLSREFDVSAPWLNRVIERKGKQSVKAVDDVTLEIRKGKTFALVGESGSGKSTIARMVVGLIEPTKGAVKFDDVDIWDAANKRQVGELRRRFQMIFQDPYASLNPRWRVRDIVAEPLKTYGIATTSAEINKEVGRLLEVVKLSPEDGIKYPHQFSGGQRQRICIARALANRPEFIVCDEPTSALDVSVQAQILNLMRDLQDEFGLTYLFISHNLAVVNYMADEVGVLYLGRLAEIAPPRVLFERARHPYTRSLLDSVPDMEMTGRERHPVKGEIPNPISPPSGCAFHPRCPFANDRCRREVPLMKAQDGVVVACHGVEEGRI